jgi:glycosyltransferase involved in cell wall biosynthesis
MGTIQYFYLLCKPTYKSMPIPSKNQLFVQMSKYLENTSSSNWEEITEILSNFIDSVPTIPGVSSEEFLRQSSKGTAFITFDYGIDGVSIEISKYAQALQSLFKICGEARIHFIGGDFYSQAESVLQPNWQRLRIEGINGWDKWDNGKWFAGLFYEDMPADSEGSKILASEIYRQAVAIAKMLGRYFVDQNISLLIPVNIASNPGNMALTLALIMVSEALGIYVINSNHDYYWDGGKPASEYAPDEPTGVRDHFFRNIDNTPFFNLFKSLYPWNGRRWLQVNINGLQTKKLIECYGFPKGKVFEIGTYVSDEFFADYTQDDVKFARLRMGHILSGGDPVMSPLPVDAHFDGLEDWMRNQTPRILGARSGLRVDPTSDNLIYLLQPTRIVARKRIERNLFLIQGLLQRGPLRKEFEVNQNLQLVLHITGPTPIEHQTDHERVLHAYLEIRKNVPVHISDRIFLAFSVGHEYHASFHAKNYPRLHIEDIYRMASAVPFPSKTEGRGLPIIESSACGVPIICSRYDPEEVFAGVVGENLTEEQQIRYILFPEEPFSDTFLKEVTDLLLKPELNKARIQHNKVAVRSRYSFVVLEDTFRYLLDRLSDI